MDSGLVKRILSSLKCDQCGQTYEARHVRVIGRHEDFWLLTAYCPKCDIQYLIVAALKDEKVKPVSDLTQAEVTRFKRVRINGNDVLDMHRYLDSFDGDFSRIFAKK